MRTSSRQSTPLRAARRVPHRAARLVHGVPRPASNRRPSGRYEMPTDDGPVVPRLWLNSGLGCDGDSVALTAAMQPSIEEIVLGALPGLPKVQVHWLLIDYQYGDDFMQWFWKADRGELEPFVLVVEGSIPNEEIKKEGYWAAMGNRVEHGGRGRQAMKTRGWARRIGRRAVR